MCENKRALISKATIEGNGATHVYYSFSPTRVKFWMGFLVALFSLVGMLWALKVGAESAVDEFVKSRCAEYLQIFHQEVRPQLDLDRHADIDAAIAAHEAVTGAEYAANNHEIQMELAKAITELRVAVAAILATQAERKLSEDAQTRMLQELMRRGK